MVEVVVVIVDTPWMHVKYVCINMVHTYTSLSYILLRGFWCRLLLNHLFTSLERRQCIRMLRMEWTVKAHVVFKLETKTEGVKIDEGVRNHYKLFHVFIYLYKFVHACVLVHTFQFFYARDLTTLPFCLSKYSSFQNILPTLHLSNSFCLKYMMPNSFYITSMPHLAILQWQC